MGTGKKRSRRADAASAAFAAWYATAVAANGIRAMPKRPGSGSDSRKEGGPAIRWSSAPYAPNSSATMKVKEAMTRASALVFIRGGQGVVPARWASRRAGGQCAEVASWLETSPPAGPTVGSCIGRTS
jgi:hypothetical protein